MRRTNTDNGIIMARHRLLLAARMAEKNATPPGVELAHQRVRSASMILPQNQPFKDAARDALVSRPGTALATV